MTTEYRREAARKRRGDSRLSDTGGFFHTQNQTIHIFTAATRQKVRTIYGIFQFCNRRFTDFGNRAWRRSWYLGRYQPLGGLRQRQSGCKCLCLVKKQNQNTSIDSSLPLFRSLKELAKICYNFQNSRTFDVAKPLYIMKGGLERYGFGRTI